MEYGTEPQYSQQSQTGQQPQSSMGDPMSQHGHQQFQPPQQGQQGFQPHQGQQGAQSPQGGIQGGPQAMEPQQGPGGQMGQRLDDALTEIMRVALHDFVQAATVTEWCADQCLDEGQEMSECIRLCRDVADIAALNQQFISRDSVFGPELVEVFITAAEACASECARHQHSHCQECAEVLSRAAKSSQEMLRSFQSQQGAQQATQMGQQY